MAIRFADETASRRRGGYVTTETKSSHETEIVSQLKARIAELEAEVAKLKADSKPWEAAGVSRATWYRKQKAT